MSVVHSPVLILSVVTVLCYLNSLICGFVFDDTSAIRDNRDILPGTPLTNLFFNDFWGIPMEKEQSHKSYRPLCVLTFKINYLLHGLDPLGYHLVNILLHLLVTTLFYQVSRMYVSSSVSFSSALMFSVHPVHTEAVTGVVGRAELLSSVFFLASLHLFTRHESRYWILTPVSAGLAMLSKEAGVTVIGLCLVHEIFVNIKLHKIVVNWISKSREKNIKMNMSSVMKISLMIVTLILLLMIRITVVQRSGLPVFTKFDNPASQAEDSVTRVLSYSYLPCLNLLLLLLPSSLCCDWTMGSVPLITSPHDPRTLSILLLITLTSMMTVKIMMTEEKMSSRLIMIMAWLIIPFLPASNILFPVGFVIAERVLYLPSMGWSLLVSVGLHKIYFKCKNNMRNAIRFLFYFTILSHSIKTIARNFDWRDEHSIFLSGISVNKDNAKLFNNFGHALESEKNYKDALILFKEAARVQPDDIGAHINIGRTLNHLEQFQDAEVAYRNAQKLLPRAVPGTSFVTRIAPNSLNLFLNLGNLVAKNSSRLEEADDLYKKAISMRSDYIQAYINRGDVLLRMNKSEEAMNIYQEALKHEPNNADIHYNLAVVALEQSHPRVAMSHLDKALEINHDHPEALLNSAILIQELGLSHMKDVAVERLLKLKQSQPRNEKIYFNLAMLAADEDNVFEAELWFRQAVELKPDFRSALFNLALLLADSHRSNDALEPLEQLLHYHPDHKKGLILIGDIYTNVKKDFIKAEQYYERYETSIFYSQF